MECEISHRAKFDSFVRALIVRYSYRFDWGDVHRFPGDRNIGRFEDSLNTFGDFRSDAVAWNERHRSRSVIICGSRRIRISWKRRTKGEIATLIDGMGGTARLSDATEDQR